MTDKDLRRLKRAELLEILVEQSKEIDRLKRRLERTRAQLESRNIAIAQSGSIAEAALALNNLFEDAQAAADLYLENIRRLQTEQREQIWLQGMEGQYPYEEKE